MKFTSALLALAAVSSASAFTITTPTNNGIQVEWTTNNGDNNFQMKITDTGLSAQNGYACIGISYGANGGYHNSMESFCTSSQDGGAVKLFVGPSNSKSMPVFPTGPTGYNAAPGGNNPITAVAITTNGGTSTTTFTRNKANRYTGGNIETEPMNTGRFLDGEWYYEDNKEYVIWYASGNGKQLNQKHDGTGKWSAKEELFRVTDPLVARECPADYVCTGLGELYTGNNLPLPQTCQRQNECRSNDCCERAVIENPPAEEVPETEIPGGSGTGDTTTPPPATTTTTTTTAKSLCPADFPCATGWKLLPNVMNEKCFRDPCEVSDCCESDGTTTTTTQTNDNVGNSPAPSFAPSAVSAVLAGVVSLFLYL